MRLADDTQFYRRCKPHDNGTAVFTLEHCTEAISTWMAVNRLKLNADKSVVIWIGSKGPMTKFLEVAFHWL